MTLQETARLEAYCQCVITLEYSWHDYKFTSTTQAPLDFYFEGIVDGWYSGRLHQNPFAPHPTAVTLFPRLKYLKGTTSQSLDQGCNSAEFTIPCRTFQGILQPLAQIYRHEALALSLVATTAHEIVLDMTLIRPALFLLLKRNPTLRRFDLTRRLKHPWVADWDTTYIQSSWARARPTLLEERPPLEHVTLRSFDVANMFMSLVDTRMFGPVTKIRILRLHNFNLVARNYSSSSSMSSRSDYVARLVDTEDEGVDGDISMTISPPLEQLEGMEQRSLDFETTEAIATSSNTSVVLLTTAASQPHMLLTADAVAMMNDEDAEHRTPGSFHTAMSDGSQSSSTSPLPLDNASITPGSNSDVDQFPPGHLHDSQGSASSSVSPHASYSSQAPSPVYHFGFNIFNDVESSGGSGSMSGSSWISTAASQHPPIESADRRLLERIAESCPELELLVLEEAWDWAKLVAPLPEVGGTGRWESTTAEGLSRVRLKLDFKRLSSVEERLEELIGGIKRAMKQKGRKRVSRKIIQDMSVSSVGMMRASMQYPPGHLNDVDNMADVDQWAEW